MLHTLQCRNHWICIVVCLRAGAAYVLDPLDKDPEEYKDFIGILSSYVYKNQVMDI
jgi:hypothetical protein